MTGFDIFFVVLATLDIIFVALLAFIGLHMLETAKRGQQQVEPALREAKSVADRGKAMAKHAQEDGLATAARVKAVVQKVKQRVETTKRIAGELKPHGQETSQAVQQSREELARKAESAKDLGRRLGRLKAAAQAAAEAARRPSP